MRRMLLGPVATALGFSGERRWPPGEAAFLFMKPFCAICAISGDLGTVGIGRNYQINKLAVILFHND